METEGLLPCAKKPATGPYTESEAFKPHLDSLSPSNIHSNIIFPSTSRSSDWSLPFRSSDQNFLCISHLSFYANRKVALSLSIRNRL